MLLGGIKSESWQAQVLELENRMDSSRAGWKLVRHYQPFVDTLAHLLDKVSTNEN